MIRGPISNLYVFQQANSQAIMVVVCSENYPTGWTESPAGCSNVYLNLFVPVLPKISAKAQFLMNNFSL